MRVLAKSGHKTVPGHIFYEVEDQILVSLDGCLNCCERAIPVCNTRSQDGAGTVEVVRMIKRKVNDVCSGS